MSKVDIQKFKNDRNWVINKEVVVINKIESTRYDLGAELALKHVPFKDVDPQVAVLNVVKNVGLLTTGEFISVGNGNILGRISNVVGKTLIRTDWLIPKTVFDTIVVNYTAGQGIPEEHFYVTSK